MDRIMIKASRLTRGFEFRIFSREDKLLGEIYVSRSTFKDLEERGYAVQHGSESYAIFQRDYCCKEVSAQFARFSHSGKQISGREEFVTLDYEKLMAFVRASDEPDGPHTWRGLSVVSCAARPRMVFRSNKRLRECLDHKDVRHKLLKFLRNNFKWPRAEWIEFYSDFEPYSFFFQAYRNGEPATCGGMILHGQDDMPKAYYSIHT